MRRIGRMRGLTVALGSAMLLALAGQAAAHGWIERLQSRLELTDDQRRALEEILSRDRQARHQLSVSLRRARAELDRLALDGAAPDVLQGKATEVEGLLAQQLQARVQRLQEIAPLLTPEQRAKFAQLGPKGHRRRGSSS